MKPFWRRVSSPPPPSLLYVTVPEGDWPLACFGVYLDEPSLRAFAAELDFVMEPVDFASMMIRLYGGTLLPSPHPEGCSLRLPGWDSSLREPQGETDQAGLTEQEELPEPATPDSGSREERPAHGCSLTWCNAEVQSSLVVTAGVPQTALRPEVPAGLINLAVSLSGSGARCAVLVEQVREGGESFEVVALSLHLPGCPHEIVESLRPLARQYLAHPSFDPDKGGELLSWRTARVAILIAPPGTRPQLHLCVPGQDWPEDSSPGQWEPN